MFCESLRTAHAAHLCRRTRDARRSRNRRRTVLPPGDPPPNQCSPPRSRFCRNARRQEHTSNLTSLVSALGLKCMSGPCGLRQLASIAGMTGEFSRRAVKPATNGVRPGRQDPVRPRLPLQCEPTQRCRGVAAGTADPSFGEDATVSAAAASRELSLAAGGNTGGPDDRRGFEIATVLLVVKRLTDKTSR